MLDNHLIPHSLKCLDLATCHCPIPASCLHLPLLTQLLSHGYAPYSPLPFLCPFFVVVVQWLNCVRCTLWPHAQQGFPVLHHLLEFGQTHVHWVSDIIQPSHPLLPPSPILNLSQHQGLFQWICSIRWPKYGASASASVLPTNIQGSFPLGLTGLISLLSRRLSRVFSSTTVQKHQFFSTQPSLWFSCHIHTWLLWKPELWLYGPLLAKKRLCFLICCLGLS